MINLIDIFVSLNLLDRKMITNFDQKKTDLVIVTVPVIKDTLIYIKGILPKLNYVMNFFRGLPKKIPSLS